MTIGPWAYSLLCPLYSLMLLAASPEGSLYFWGNALQDTPSVVRASVDVGEGYSLALVGLGHASRFLLATTLGTLFLISPPLLSQTQVCMGELLHRVPVRMLLSTCTCMHTHTHTHTTAPSTLIYIDGL